MEGGGEIEAGRVPCLPLQISHRNDRSTGSFKYFNNLLYREWRFEYLAVPRYPWAAGILPLPPSLEICMKRGIAGPSKPVKTRPDSR